MFKNVLMALILILAATYSAQAWTDNASMESALVVDRYTRNKVLNDYVLLTRDAIQRAWKTPLDLSVPGSVKGRVRVNYTVTNTGTLESVELVGTSGNRRMDQSLIKAMRAAQPFPQFPDDIRAPKVMVRANFIVADLPTAEVVRTTQPVSVGDVSRDPLPEVERKKLIWGRPAGNAGDGDIKFPDLVSGAEIRDNYRNQPPLPPTPDRKLRWGADR